MNKKTLTLAVVLIGAIGVGYWYYTTKMKKVGTTEEETTEEDA